MDNYFDQIESFSFICESLKCVFASVYLFTSFLFDKNDLVNLIRLQQRDMNTRTYRHRFAKKLQRKKNDFEASTKSNRTIRFEKNGFLFLFKKNKNKTTCNRNGINVYLCEKKGKFQVFVFFFSALNNGLVFDLK